LPHFGQILISKIFQQKSTTGRKLIHQDCYRNKGFGILADFLNQ